MSNRGIHRRSNSIGVDDDKRLKLVKVLFFATGLILTYENIFGIFEDFKLRLMAIIIGGSLMFLGSKEVISTFMEEVNSNHGTLKRVSNRGLQNRCQSPNSLTLQTYNVAPRIAKGINGGRRSSKGEGTDTTQIESIDTDLDDLYNAKRIDKLSSEARISRENIFGTENVN
uniref:Uncharacterized protein n=1 Tax=Parastrongyloides trichosuri TaxID=131310 RepID=A0A0N4Z7L6_PARTI